MFHAIERFLEIQKARPEFHLPFRSFLLNLGEGVEVVSGGVVLSEARLVTREFTFRGWLQPSIENNREQIVQNWLYANWSVVCRLRPVPTLEKHLEHMFVPFFGGRGTWLQDRIHELK